MDGCGAGVPESKTQLLKDPLQPELWLPRASVRQAACRAGLRGRVACFSLSWARTHLLRALWSSLHGVGVWVLEIRSTSGGSARVAGGQRPAALLPTEGQPWGWPRALGGGSWVGLGPRSNFLCLWTDRHLSRPQSVPCSVPLTSSEVLRYRRC